MEKVDLIVVRGDFWEVIYLDNNKFCANPDHTSKFWTTLLNKYDINSAKYYQLNSYGKMIYEFERKGYPEKFSEINIKYYM
jgi:hypothetical protein